MQAAGQVYDAVHRLLRVGRVSKALRSRTRCAVGGASFASTLRCTKYAMAVFRRSGTDVTYPVVREGRYKAQATTMAFGQRFCRGLLFTTLHVRSLAFQCIHPDNGVLHVEQDVMIHRSLGLLGPPRPNICNQTTFRNACSPSRLSLVTRCCTDGHKKEPLYTPPLIQTSLLFYTGMTVTATTLGKAFDVPVVLLDGSVDPVPTTAAVGLLVAIALVTQRYTDQIPALKEIETLTRITLVPALRTSPWWVRGVED